MTLQPDRRLRRDQHVEGPERLPPNEIEAEKALLGSVVANGSLFNEVSWLDARDFYNARHERIWAAMRALSERDDPIDLVMISSQIARDEIDEGEVVLYLSSLLTFNLSFQIGQYARLISRAAVQRRLISAAGKIAGLGYVGVDPGEPIESLVDSAVAIVDGVLGEQAAEPVVSLTDALRSFYEAQSARGEGDDRFAIPTGFTDLDERINGGFQRGDLVVLGARPSIGKTALSLALALRAAQEQRGVVMFSLEMARNQITARLVAQRAPIALTQLIANRYNNEEGIRVGRAFDSLTDLPLAIDDTSSITVQTMRARLRQLLRRQPVDLVIVDHLQLMTGHAREESRTQELSRVSRELKGLAKDLNVVVVALSQLSREVERRPKKRPILSDLRESGSIEQDADLVILLYRDDYYDPQSTRANLMDLNIAKQRNGETGPVTLFFNRTTGGFFDADLTFDTEGA